MKEILPILIFLFLILLGWIAKKRIKIDWMNVLVIAAITVTSVAIYGKMTVDMIQEEATRDKERQSIQLLKGELDETPCILSD